MANIKFSQFTVGNTESDIDFVVGYKGANNIQISPTNLLAASLSGYLPLTGGTMTGSIIFNDGVKAKFGDSGDLQIQHTGSTGIIDNQTGDLIFKVSQDNGDIIVQSDNGSGGIDTYFRVDGGDERTEFEKAALFNDDVGILFGSGGDSFIKHTGSQMSMFNDVGNMVFTNRADDADMIFSCDNGSGGTAEYFRLDGGDARMYASREIRFIDGVASKYGNSGDLAVYHNGTNSLIENNTGNLNIINYADDKDITFRCDDGGGGIDTYFFLDGSSSKTVFPDNKQIQIGSGGGDGYIYSDGTNMWIQGNNPSADIKLYQGGTDGSIRFYSDNGSGGVAEYFAVDGGEEQVRFFKNTEHADNVKATFGNSGDMEIYHDGSNSFIRNTNTNLIIKNEYNDGDIIFESDDGSGNIAEYIRVDGSATTTVFSKNTRHGDNVELRLGSGSDFKAYHSGTNTVLENETGDLYIKNNFQDRDIIFQSDNGGGGIATYFQLDGSRADLNYTYTTRPDGGVITFGGNLDLRIWRDPIVNKSFIRNYNDDFIIENLADDKDIIFNCDNGSGGSTEYFRLDGGTTSLVVSAALGMYFNDGVAARFGTGGDLIIYHDGSNSYITDTGTGFLNISSDAALVLSNASGETYFIATSNGSTKLYYDNSSKLETRSTGIKISGVLEYADNTAAIAGGLTTGDVYRTGDLLKIVH